MHNRRHLVTADRLAYDSRVRDVGLDERCSRDGTSMPRYEAIQHHHVEPSVGQCFDRMASDITGATGHEDRAHYLPIE